MKKNHYLVSLFLQSSKDVRHVVNKFYPMQKKCKHCGEYLNEAYRISQQNKQTINKLLYIILALFLGRFGIHNFYAGQNKKSTAQLIISSLGTTSFLVILMFVENDNFIKIVFIFLIFYRICTLLIFITVVSDIFSPLDYFKKL